MLTQKTGGIKLTFISSVSPYPEEEYYLGKSTWSASAADWDQRFEVGDVVADPSGSWEPSTAQQYIDGQIANVTTSIASETIARQAGDNNLSTQLSSEMNTRANQDANLNALINAGIREGGGVQFDIVPTQNSANGITSGGMYSTLRDSNIGFVDDVPTVGSDNLVKSGGIISSLMIPSEEWEYQNKYVTDNLQIGDVITYNNVQSGWMSFKVFVSKGSTIFLYNIVTNSSAHHIYVTDLSECVIEIIDKIGDNNTRHDYEYTATRDCFIVSSSGLNSAVYVNMSTPSQSVFTKVYTYANMSYQGYFRSVGAEVGKVLDLSPERIIYHASYRTEIVKVNRDAVINIINFSSISECPYIIITDINKKIVDLISTNIEYTCSEPGFIIFTCNSIHSLAVTIDYNNNFLDNSNYYKGVDVFGIFNKNCYYHKDDFIVGQKCCILKTTPVVNPSAPQNALHPIVIFLKEGESALLFRAGYDSIDDNKFVVVDANTFNCIDKINFESVANKIITYKEYVATQDVYILANGIGIDSVTNIKISQSAKSYSSIESCFLDTISRLNIKNKLKPIENGQWYPGFIGTDGVLNYTGSGNFITSIFFKIPNENQSVLISNTIRVNNDGALDIAFYDSDMTFISGIGRSTTNYYTLIGGTIDTISVPNNAVYYRLTQTASNFIPKSKVYLEYEDMYSLKNIKTDVYKPAILARTTGFIEKGNSSWSISDALRCIPGTTVFFNFSEGYNQYVAQIVVYDKNGLMLVKLENSTGYIKIPEGAEFLRMTTDNGVTLNANNNIIDCYCSQENGISLYNPSVKRVPNLLILGDSYSQQQNWIRSLRQFINIENVVNLARGSATMKDQFTDKTQYPYTSRPQNGDNGSARRQNNLNTFCCQLALLDRLMEGTDLDSGETQLYANPSTYPDLIIIQGGKNDAIENDVTINSYANIIREKVTAYAKRSNEDSPTQQSVCLIKSIDDVDRTTFIGAMYVLYESLHQKFPNAVIVFINPSDLQYGNADVWYDAAKSDEMDIASKILSVPVIDWNRQGRLSYVFDHITTGDGTQNNPYIINSPTEFTSDMLHPNIKGAAYLGKVAAGFLNNYL